jgi:hypothetical protein
VRAQLRGAGRVGVAAGLHPGGDIVQQRGPRRQAFGIGFAQRVRRSSTASSSGTIMVRRSCRPCTMLAVQRSCEVSNGRWVDITRIR